MMQVAGEKRREKDRKQSENASSWSLLKLATSSYYRRAIAKRAGAPPPKSDGKSSTAKTGPTVPATPALEHIIYAYLVMLLGSVYLSVYDTGFCGESLHSINNIQPIPRSCVSVLSVLYRFVRWVSFSSFFEYSTYPGFLRTYVCSLSYIGS